MKIAVVGAGIVGVCTAYELARDGHQVTVLDRRNSVAEEASFASGSLLGPGHVQPATGAVDHGLRLAGRDMAWLWQRRKQPPTPPARLQTLSQLALYSQAQRHRVATEQQLAFDRAQGLMLLFRSEQDSQRAQPRLQALREAGIGVKDLTPAIARKLELALNPDTAFFGAAYLQDDELGNCRQFALLLKNAAQALGVRFVLNASVQPLQRRAPTQLTVAGQTQAFDAVVLCAGADSARLLKPLGRALPLAAVQGWSVSAQIREPLNAPRSAIWDERHGVSISCIGHRVRVAGGAEMGRGDDKARSTALPLLYRVLHDWFPGAARVTGDVQEWRAALPVMVDGLPRLGASGIPGVWLNLGHGASGWALANGSARVLADQVAGRAAAVPLNGLTLA